MSTIESNIAENLFEDMLRSTPKSLVFVPSRHLTTTMTVCGPPADRFKTKPKNNICLAGITRVPHRTGETTSICRHCEAQSRAMPYSMKKLTLPSSRS